MNGRARVLVIDDSPQVCELLRSRLADMLIDFRFVQTGGEALDTANHNGTDLILLDINLCDMSGLEVCRLLKQMPQTHDIPVIFLSGVDDMAAKVRAFDLGAVDYIVKPFEPAELRARVRSALRTKALMDMLTVQAQIDGLSGLRNRRYFDQRLDEEAEAARRYARNLGLLLIDVDQFKQINDSFGHPAGDQIIQRFAALLSYTARKSDVACRYGGDEFALILHEADAGRVEDCGRRLVQAVSDDRVLQRLVETGVTISAGGAAISPRESVDSDRLIQRADEALYASKRDGRSKCTVAGATETVG